jgi:hypothetical protein
VPCDGATPLPADKVPEKLTLFNLDQLNQFANVGKNVFLKSKDDVSKNPPWLQGILPDAAGRVPNAKTCCVVVVDKGNGIVDAFWFYFYAFNWGGIVLDMKMGIASISLARRLVR